MPAEADSARALVSVILPVRAPDPALLARCLASFDALPWAPRLELVVVHTGPFEPALLQPLRRIGGRSLVECAEPGIYTAFNAGLERAGGRFLLFFGHDDIALPDMQHVLEYLDTLDERPALVACRIYVQGLGIRRPSWLRQGIVFRNWGHQALFYSAALFRTRRYDPRYPLRADHRLNIALLADPGVRCERLPQVVSYFARGGFSSRTIEDHSFDAEQAVIAGSEFGPLWGLAVRTLLPVVRGSRRLLRAVTAVARR